MKTKEEKAAYMRKWRADLTPEKKATLLSRRALLQRVSRKAESERRKPILEEMKSLPCLDCGHTFPTRVMEWHHRDPSTKRFQIAQHLAYPWRDVLDEIAKCDLLCANCHRIRG